jgi:hypothetical protein
MNTRIFSASIFCAALLCPALLSGCAIPIPAGTRPEITQPLQEAQTSAEHHDYTDVGRQIAVAEAVPNQSPEERELVARVKWNLTASNMGNDNFAPIGPDPGPQMGPTMTNGR